MASTDAVSEAQRSRRTNWNNQIARHAQMIPDRTALRFLGDSITWSTLDARVEKLADALARRGVSFGDRVLILMLNRPRIPRGRARDQRTGRHRCSGELPSDTTRGRLSGKRLRLQSHCRRRTVGSVGRSCASRVRGYRHLHHRSAPAEGDSLNYEDLISEEGESHAFVDIPDDTPALIMYTSGTTGRPPKGSVLSHSNLSSQALTCIRAFHLFNADSIGFCASPMFHIAALGSIAPSLQLGTTTVIHPVGAFDPGQLLDILEAEKVTSLFLVPVQWQAVCAVQKAQPRALSLKNISWGAAPSSDTILRAMAETFPDAFNVAVFGQTEMSPITCVLDGEDAIRKLGSVGRVIPTISARVVDENMDDVAPGEIGEIVYRGPTMMSEYWNNPPTATADAFHGGWFHSGDLVRVDDEGFVYVVDRKKDMIISGGENIYCAEVENVLYEHELIVEAAVVGRPTPSGGEVPVAIVAMAPGSAVDLTIEELSSFLNDRLARYKHPKDIVVVEALPRNASGKVVKGELREKVRAVDAVS